MASLFPESMALHSMLCPAHQLASTHAAPSQRCARRCQLQWTAAISAALVECPTQCMHSSNDHILKDAVCVVARD